MIRNFKVSSAFARATAFVLAFAMLITFTPVVPGAGKDAEAADGDAVSNVKTAGNIKLGSPTDFDKNNYTYKFGKPDVDFSAGSGLTIILIHVNSGSFTISSFTDDKIKDGVEGLKFGAVSLDSKKYISSLKEAEDSKLTFFSITANNENAKLTSASVENLIKNITFYQTKGTAQKVSAVVSAVDLDGKSAMADDNGRLHFYEFVPYSAKDITDKTASWQNAYAEAKTKTFNGLKGYLATITSEDEQKFVVASLGTNEGWIGGTRMVYDPDIAKDASKADADGDTYSLPEDVVDKGLDDGGLSYDTPYNKLNIWYWVDGPEKGTPFCYGVNNSEVTSDTNKELNKNTYFTWCQGEPNNTRQDEFFVTYAYQGQADGRWNDWSNKAVYSNENNNTGWGASGYYVEYGGYPEEDNDAGDDDDPKAPIAKDVQTIDLDNADQAIAIQIAVFNDKHDNVKEEMIPTYDQNSTTVGIKDNPYKVIIPYSRDTETATLNVTHFGQVTVDKVTSADGSKTYNKKSDDDPDNYKIDLNVGDNPVVVKTKQTVDGKEVTKDYYVTIVRSAKDTPFSVIPKNPDSSDQTKGFTGPKDDPNHTNDSANEDGSKDSYFTITADNTTNTLKLDPVEGFDVSKITKVTYKSPSDSAETDITNGDNRYDRTTGITTVDTTGLSKDKKTEVIYTVTEKDGDKDITHRYHYTIDKEGFNVEVSTSPTPGAAEGPHDTAEDTTKNSNPDTDDIYHHITITDNVDTLIVKPTGVDISNITKVVVSGTSVKTTVKDDNTSDKTYDDKDGSVKVDVKDLTEDKTEEVIYTVKDSDGNQTNYHYIIDKKVSKTPDDGKDDKSDDTTPSPTPGGNSSPSSTPGGSDSPAPARTATPGAAATPAAVTPPSTGPNGIADPGNGESTGDEGITVTPKTTPAPDGQNKDFTYDVTTKNDTITLTPDTNVPADKITTVTVTINGKPGALGTDYTADTNKIVTVTGLKKGTPVSVTYTVTDGSNTFTYTYNINKITDDGTTGLIVDEGTTIDIDKIPEGQLDLSKYIYGDPEEVIYHNCSHTLYAIDKDGLIRCMKLKKNKKFAAATIHILIRNKGSRTFQKTYVNIRTTKVTPFSSYNHLFKDKRGLEYEVNGENTCRVSERNYKTKKKKIIIPNTVKDPGTGKVYTVNEIAPYAFLQSMYIQYVKIGKNVETIGNTSFTGMQKLKKFVVAPGNKYIKTASKRGKYAHIILSKDGKHLRVLANIRGSIKIPESVQQIDEYACATNHITKLVIPKTVKRIDPCAFAHNRVMTSVKISSKFLMPFECIFDRMRSPKAKVYVPKRYYRYYYKEFKKAHDEADPQFPSMKHLKKK
ncbi:MAG: leucine-rich repeat protein [Lachnospiraceae bacterium]|nr:leucine-rich repeat protein [Lachnospiraceae bacterium]